MAAIMQRIIIACRLMDGLAALWRDRRGISAVEFALIVPIMITLYVGAVEFSHALTIDRRVTTVASSAADLVAQSEELTDSELQDIFKAAGSIMAPYSTSPLKMVLTSVVADVNNKTTVDWSAASSGSAYAKNANFALPAGLTQPFSSVIVAEVTYNYDPAVGQFLSGGITMTEKFYLRPRRSLKVAKQ